MRPVAHGDLVAAALALMPVPPAARPRLLDRMILEAEAADHHRLTTGKAHPLWGTGSLMAAAMARPRPPEPALENPDYAICLVTVLERLIARARGGSPASRIPRSAQD
ncbi:MAG: hypothetical protein CR993_01655 [Rhodobacterales bacterium]|nr:MAG: hypothetical protein CR993_01655 [Rhodobacterales bacterium]